MSHFFDRLTFFKRRPEIFAGGQFQTRKPITASASAASALTARCPSLSATPATSSARCRVVAGSSSPVIPQSMKAIRPPGSAIKLPGCGSA